MYKLPSLETQLKATSLNMYYKKKSITERYYYLKTRTYWSKLYEAYKQYTRIINVTQTCSYSHGIALERFENWISHVLQLGTWEFQTPVL